MLNFLRLNVLTPNFFKPHWTGWKPMLVVGLVVGWLLGTSPAIAHPLATQPISTLSASTITQPIAQTMARKSFLSFSGNRPANLGVKDGKLAVCPSSPNCVSSQSPDSDAEHYIDPFRFSGTAPEAIAKLRAIIEGMDRTEIVQQTETYLYAEFTSALMGFVDDVEFFADPETNTVQVRSASRLGQSDLGVNRKRVEEIRAAFSA